MDSVTQGPGQGEVLTVSHMFQTPFFAENVTSDSSRTDASCLFYDYKDRPLS